MINKITIQNAATFNGIQTIETLKRLNFFFGANGSGKTTISKVIGNVAQFPNCSIAWNGGTILDTRVYNRDFVEKNFVQTGTVKGVFTLGAQQTETLKKINDTKGSIDQLEQEIAQLKKTLAGEDDKGGKKSELTQLEEEYKEKFWKAKINHEDKLKAGMTGFLNDRNKFKAKVLEEAGKTSTQLLSLSELENKAETVFDKTLDEVSPLKIPTGESLLVHEKNAILGKLVIGKENVDIAAIIKKLENSDWVRQGIPFFERNEGICPFCQQKTGEKLKQSLNEYFDESFQNDTQSIASLLSAYQGDSETIKAQIQMLINENNKFIDLEKLKAQKSVMDALISSNVQKMQQKQKEPSQAVVIETLQPTLELIISHLNEANKKIDNHNAIVRNRTIEKKTLTAQIWRFVVEELTSDIENYKQKKNEIEKAITNLSVQIATKEDGKRIKQSELQALEKQTTSIQPTLDSINRLLASFGFQSFKLTKTTDGKSYKLLRQNGIEVNQTLSEGEKNFLAFLYFYHLLKGSHEESGTTSNKIVVFDDPICSLDNDVLFIVSTLIRGLYDEVKKDCGTIKQLFILTHNVYFHKEVTFRQTPSSNNTFWLIKKNGAESTIEKQENNPISTSYELLWNEVKDECRNKATIQNTLRRILENYFQMLGNTSLHDLPDKFDGENKIKCKALVSWIHDGSHSVLSEDFYTSLDDVAIKRYLDVFKQIFEKSGHIAHYNMMMNINPEDVHPQSKVSHEQ